MKILPINHVFKFKELCPYCKADMTYELNEWEEDGEYWKAVGIDGCCLNEPDITDMDEWNEWFGSHSEMPYVIQLPVDEKVLSYINKRYRFTLTTPSGEKE